MGDVVAMIVVAAALGLAGDRFLVWLNQQRRDRDDLDMPHGRPG